MKKNLVILMFALFAFACSGNPDQTKDSSSENPETVIVEENLQKIENAAEEIIDEAEELAKEVESLIENI